MTIASFAESLVKFFGSILNNLVLEVLEMLAFVVLPGVVCSVDNLMDSLIWPEISTN